MVSLHKSIDRVIRTKYSRGPARNSFPYIVNATMTADEFIDTSAIYSKQLVSYSVRIESAETDLIRVIWDYDPLHFGAAGPEPLLFPYPHNLSYTNTRYYIKFIPVADFQKLNLVHVWDNSALIAGVKFSDVSYASHGYTEKAGGFIDKNYHNLYLNCFSSLGIIMEFRMRDNSVLKCYVITSDLYDNTTPRYVRWKIRI